MEKQRRKGHKGQGKGEEIEKGTHKRRRQKKEGVEMEDLKTAVKQPL
jgi:hypothetical protein